MRHVKKVKSERLAASLEEVDEELSLAYKAPHHDRAQIDELVHVVLHIAREAGDKLPPEQHKLML